MSKLEYLKLLVSQYNEMMEEGIIEQWYDFSTFVENEWECRYDLVDGWDDNNPAECKYSLSFYAGKLLDII